jgi:hypothetical protein
MANPQTETIDEGWIKLHRKIQRSAVFQNEGLLKVWIWCLVRASHQDEWVSVTTGKGETEVLVKRGQFMFGRKSAAKTLKMDESTVYKRMQKLENMQNLNIRSNTHYSIVTILNWYVYQSTTEAEVTPKVTSKEQPSNTYKNVENKEHIYTVDFLKFWEAYPNKSGKFEAFKSWKKWGPDLEVVQKAIQAQTEVKKRLKTQNQFCPEWPNGSTWLNNKRWEDEGPDIPGKDKSW